MIKTPYGIAKKYNNGLLEVLEKQTYSKATVNTVWGSGYTSNLYTLNFPKEVTFLEPPQVVTSCNSNGSVAILTPSDITVTGFAFYLNRFTASTLNTATVSYQAIGHWK